ncbi:MAG: helicase-related protein, partial [Thermoguttaceae bacterium]|nr:helicase-related protein [Thermoguttaceae bacterium]
TSQQFQRASSMICACEMIRRRRPKELGEEPITIGLWVGESLTPLYREDALKSLNNLAKENSQEANTFQLLTCPWCGTALDEHDNLGYVADGRPKTVVFVCPEPACEFSTRKHKLPVIVIDDDVYAAPPTLVIGTVDKFAMLAWREESGRLFGIGVDGDHDPPDLIIQDELHLISGPLGSVVGLYETAIDMLCSWKGRRPKIVASTATIRRAWHQCKSLYNRTTSQFPPQGLDISDSFFAKENSTASGRLYAGVFATASPSFVTALVRTLGGLFQSCNAIKLPDGANEKTRDPYWTILQYFSSLRELGHAATLIEADIPEYMWSIATRTNLPKELCRSLGSPAEMTSRRTADEIPDILERLHVRHPRKSDNLKDRPLDTLLATNMISVGVDVDRLGLMVVVGQPKTTSEYIQASSRVGRSQGAPGLVIAMYNPGKPRDRSHYEHFRAYHEAFYKHVEPTSVTPFSLPVLERALHAVLVVLARHYARLHTPNAFVPTDTSITRVAEFIRERCVDVDSEHAYQLAEKLQTRLAQWASVLPSEWGRFGKPPEARPLMYPAGSDPLSEWAGSPWATPTSMRNVDVECEARVVSAYEVSD